MSAKELLERAEELRRNARFGDAINFYRAAAEAPDATDEIIGGHAGVEMKFRLNGEDELTESDGILKPFFERIFGGLKFL